MPKTRNVSDLPGEIDAGVVASFNQLNGALAAIGALPHHEVTELVDAAAATDLATSVALANDLKAKYVAHIADTDAHQAADETNGVTAADATDLASAQTLLNELKVDLNAHIVLATAHRGEGGGSGAGGVEILAVSTANAIDQATANALANALKAAMNRHFGAGSPDIQLVAS